MVAEKAAKGIADIQVDEDAESSKEDGEDHSAPDKGSEDEEDKLRKNALDKLENASEESFLGQASSINSITSGPHSSLVL